jgi:hypothetical protein
MPVILAILEAEIGKSLVQGQPCQKVLETPFQPIRVCTCHPNATGKHEYADHGSGQPGHDGETLCEQY